MTKALTVHTTFDVDDGEATKRSAQVLKHKGGLFPADMTEAQAAALARLSLLYRLDLMANELSLFQGRPYLTLLGAVRVANEHEAFRGMTCEPATPAEREAFRARDDEELWIARVYRSDRDVPAVGYGRASRTDDQPVARKWTQEQAQARAKRRALRDAFSLPVPGLEDVGEDAGPIIEHAVRVEPTAPKISLGQTKAIHAVVRQLGITDQEYRARLREMFGVRSSQDLNMSQAQAALEAFTAELAAQAEDAPLDTSVAAVKDREAGGGIRSRDAITLPDEPESVAVGGEVQWEGSDFPPRTEGQKQEPSLLALDRYAAALTRAQQLGIDLEPFNFNAGTITAAELALLDDALRETIVQNEPTERLGGM